VRRARGRAAAAAGFRRIRILAVACWDAEGPDLAQRSPCGACRQVIREFADERTLILLDRNDDNFSADILDIDRLLPWGFSLQNDRANTTG
jgi:cytidine deaminase